MLYELFVLVATLASTFMAADTTAHILDVNPERISKILLYIWIGTLVLTLLDGDWMSTLGCVHTFFYLACALLAYMSPGEDNLKRDYIRIPLTIFVPTFLSFYIMHYSTQFEE
ncbi:unnamed protein product [Phytomonas sp. Hart1]|nr:unnamed protein product [Phytomonas sp. Hart1]|eukprot:CCW70451.1 unnamed protein product [Phytomonas sp. isolate Hart1]